MGLQIFIVSMVDGRTLESNNFGPSSLLKKAYDSGDVISIVDVTTPTRPRIFSSKHAEWMPLMSAD